MAWTAPATDPAPDAALTRAFSGCLPGGRLAGPLLGFASVSSTQVVCRALAAAGAPEGTVVLADHQTAGRGRRGRAWVAPPGTALLFTCLLRPPFAPACWPQLTLAAGCAVAEGIEATSRITTRLKWPNDVLADGRKVAGILTEGIVGADPFVVLGIGVNVRQDSTDWPAELGARAVSLAALGGTCHSESLLAAILDRLAAHYDALLSSGFEPVRTAWRCRAILGDRVGSPGGDGIALDLAETGALLIRRADGATAAIVATEDSP